MLTKFKLALATTVALIGGVAGFAAAEGRGGPDHQGMKEKFDANKDGKIDDAERGQMKDAMKAMHAQKKAEMLAKFDANKDGQLDDAEKDAMKAERAAIQFSHLDKDGDGKLSLEEFKAAKHHQGRHGRRGGFRGRH
jgi:EF hand